MSPEPDYLAALDPSTDADGDVAGPHPPARRARGRPHPRASPTTSRPARYGRASVMDYPAPRGRDQGRQARPLRTPTRPASATSTSSRSATPTRSSAPGADEAKELEQILHDGVPHGMLFMTDADARPAGAAHPLASLWDNGADPVATLRHEMEVRRDRPRAVRARHDPGRHAAVRARGQAAAALSAPPLPARRGGQVARRRLLHLCGADRRARTPPGRRGRPGGTPARGARRGARHAQARGRSRSPRESST